MGSSSSPPHFFKVILPQTLTQQMLDVPIKFVRKYGETLETGEVCLKVVNGTKWQIRLKRIDNKIWLEKGWDDFVKFHSIGNGHFIVFKYEGNFCFQVLIFDKTATEIDYPNPSRKFRNEKVSKHEEIKGFQKKVKREGEDEFEENTQTLPSLLTSKTMKKRSDELLASGSKAKMKEVNNEDQLHISNTHVKNKVELSNLKKKDASKFKSQTKNPSFLLTIGSSYIHTAKCNVCIPANFGNNHLRGIDELTLQVSNEKTWNVSCVERLHSTGTKRFNMRNGWKIFARENKLKEGDICVFELIKNSPILFNVTIF